MTAWLRVCAEGEIDEDDLIRFDHGGRTFCVYNTAKGYFASDGLCTHEEQHLADGLVIDGVIECPLHQGRFDVATGKAVGGPVCVDLKTWPVKVEDGAIYIAVE